ncbi:MAG: hypothetical protein IAE82_20735, partial [Opitutaceae bacterium]|nr:hypothetical protein [Opitutaceae bacterium]
ALTELDREPDLTATPALQALAARARGEVAAACGDAAAGMKHLRTALRLWLSAEAPLPAAQTRCRIADLLQSLGDAESAHLELDAAVTAFELAGADGLLRQCERLKSALAARRAASPSRAPAC